VTEIVRTELGRVSVAPRALARVVVHAAESVDGARVRRARRGLRVEVAEGRARVSLELAVGRGQVLPDTARAVQLRVAEALGTMLEVEIDAVDVAIEEIQTK
jgi:uncharacterized alkaline shock family protein YloU